MGEDGAGLVLIDRVGLVESLELSITETEADTEAGGSPLGKVEVDGREGDHLGQFVDLPVVLAIIELCSEIAAEGPVAPEAAGKDGILLVDGSRDNLAIRSGSLLDNGTGVLILAGGNGLGKGRDHDEDRCDQQKYFFHNYRYYFYFQSGIFSAKIEKLFHNTSIIPQIFTKKPSRIDRNYVALRHLHPRAQKRTDADYKIETVRHFDNVSFDTAEGPLDHPDPVALRERHLREAFGFG